MKNLPQLIEEILKNVGRKITPATIAKIQKQVEPHLGKIETSDEDAQKVAFIELLLELDLITDLEKADLCDECGGPNNDGEGWNGLCGNCADRAEREGRT